MTLNLHPAPLVRRPVPGNPAGWRTVICALLAAMSLSVGLLETTAAAAPGSDSALAGTPKTPFDLATLDGLGTYVAPDPNASPTTSPTGTGSPSPSGTGTPSAGPTGTGTPSPGTSPEVISSNH